MSLSTLLTTAVFALLLACSQVWSKPPVKPQKGNTAVTPSEQQLNEETISGFLPNASGMEANLASTLCSGLWTRATHEACFQSTPQLLECRFCARVCKSKRGLTHHENKCKNRSGPPESESVPVVPPLPGNADLDQNLLLDEELVQGEEPSLTLAECSRLISAYIEHPEWQDFLDSGRHATTQTTDVNTGWAELTLDTVSPANRETPFPALTPAALATLMQLSPFINRLCRQLQTGNDPLADNTLKVLIDKASRHNNELFVRGNHSLVIKWRDGPGYVLKIARSERDHIRLTREQNLYLWLRHPDNVLINLTTTPMRAAFSVHGKPMLALRQIDDTARDRLRSMKEHSLNERLDFALSVIFHFCQMYRRFLEKDVLLADRHDDNIGFNEIPLQGRKSTGLEDAVIQVPVMLDLDPYWFGDQESRVIQLHLPTWVPVMVGLLEEVFTPVGSDSQISKSRVEVIDQLRQLASPVFSSSSTSAVRQETEKIDKETALQCCLNHWFQDISPEYSELLTEARSHIEPLLNGLNQWDSAPRTVAEWNKRLQENIGEVLQWLNSWRNASEFSLLKDFTDEGIIKVSGAQGGTSLRDQQILTLLSVVHGKVGCQKCSRTFTTNTGFRKHWQLHQQSKLKHCEICGGDFINVTVHERIHAGDKPYKCDYCSKNFSQNGNLQVHLHTHSDNKPYRCRHCGKMFPNNNNLQRHLRIHSGDRPYQCEQCGKFFSQFCNLQTHLRSHSGDKPYKCRLCGKTCSRIDNLQNHLRTHSDERPYKCEHCGKCFSQSCNLQVHLNTHTGNKPYKCDHCDKRFSQYSTLSNHLRTHSGEKPYKCERCGRCFAQSGNLKAHLRTHSGDKP